MFKNKTLEYVESAFKIERYSYDRTIKYLRDTVSKLERELETAYNTTIKDLTSETIKQLEAEKENLQAENARLQKELDQCGKKLNATQYKEYKRLKQAEYTRRWLKKKQAQAKK